MFEVSKICAFRKIQLHVGPELSHVTVPAVSSLRQRDWQGPRSCERLQLDARAAWCPKPQFGCHAGSCGFTEVFANSFVAGVKRPSQGALPPPKVAKAKSPAGPALPHSFRCVLLGFFTQQSLGFETLEAFLQPVLVLHQQAQMLVGHPFEPCQAKFCRRAMCRVGSLLGP